MTGGLWAEEAWKPVPGRVASTLQQQQLNPPPPANDNNEVPDNQPQTTVRVLEHGASGGDGGDPWVMVLIGKEGAGKSSTGNSILGTQAFEIDRQLGSNNMEVIDSVISSIEVPVKIVDTPGYRGERGDGDNIERLVNLLQDHIHLVHSFLVIVNAKDFDQQHTFDMLRDYVKVFGHAMLSNLMVVVTNWSMSEDDSESREKEGLSREKFTETWTTDFVRTFSLESEDLIPFVFIDNLVGILGESAHLAFDETELECFESSKCAIFQHLSACPVFTCVGLKDNVAASKGYKKCSKCNRYFIPVDEKTLTETSTKVVGASQASVAAARIARVASATSRAWTRTAAVKAMTRGWGGRGGVHLFGKVASRAGLAVQVGFGVYRFMNAENSTEKAKAAIGTGAGIVGGWGGASWGATVGTLLLPGLGTVVGGIVGGVAGAVGLQMASEKCIDLFAPDVCFSCKKYEV